MFASEEAGIVPDMVTVSKALTGGTLPLAATIARDHVFDAFYTNSAGDALMHGPTYMGNALACAAANASLDLFEREPRLKQVRAIEAGLIEGLASARTCAYAAPSASSKLMKCATWTISSAASSKLAFGSALSATSFTPRRHM
jgi:adenosylmethionine-8-amino-7-oxononanoate aminotransferase